MLLENMSIECKVFIKDENGTHEKSARIKLDFSEIVRLLLDYPTTHYGNLKEVSDGIQLHGVFTDMMVAKIVPMYPTKSKVKELLLHYWSNSDC